MKHVFCIPSFFVFLILYGCNNTQNVPIKKSLILPKTIKEAITYLTVPSYFDDNSQAAWVPYSESYYFYKNKDEIKQTLTISESFRIEDVTIVFYSYQIKGKKFFKTEWLLNIDGYFLPIGIYGTGEEFSPENQKILKTINKKIGEWVNKSPKKWW